jgi:hypothetical protein
MAKKKNRNIVIIKSIDELKNEVNYADFEYKPYFTHICNLVPNVDNERLDIEEIDSQKVKDFGLVYVFVIDEKIFKIGQSITPIKSRVQSYNCGKTEYRISGTNSTTNYFVLQSLLKINKKVKVYAYFPPKKEYTLFDEKGNDSFPPVKKIENKIMRDFIKKHGKKPIGSTQR